MLTPFPVFFSPSFVVQDCEISGRYHIGMQIDEHINWDTNFPITSYEIDENYIIEIVLDKTNASDTLVKYYPSTNVLDFVVYVMSAIGAWFGFFYSYRFDGNIC